jgi:hypothetical protein
MNDNCMISAIKTQIRLKNHLWHTLISVNLLTARAITGTIAAILKGLSPSPVARLPVKINQISFLFNRPNRLNRQPANL